MSTMMRARSLSPARLLALLLLALAGADAYHHTGWGWRVRAGDAETNGLYKPRQHDFIPEAFKARCAADGVVDEDDVEDLWAKVSTDTTPWYEADNGSCMYWNVVDGNWWLDGPSGKRKYLTQHASHMHHWPPPNEGWIKALDDVEEPAPTLSQESFDDAVETDEFSEL